MSKKINRMPFVEVLKTLSVGAAKLNQMVESKEIPYYKIGKTIMFDRGEIEAWINSCHVQAATTEQ